LSAPALPALTLPLKRFRTPQAEKSKAPTPQETTTSLETSAQVVETNKKELKPQEFVFAPQAPMTAEIEETPSVPESPPPPQETPEPITSTHPPRQNIPGHKICLVGKNLSEQTLIEKLSKECGEVLSVRLNTEKGYGYMEFTTPEDASKAVERIGTWINARAFRVHSSALRPESPEREPRAVTGHHQ
jgi:hypothetical protein